jgi:hypothetical protein
MQGEATTVDLRVNKLISCNQGITSELAAPIGDNHPGLGETHIQTTG